MGTTTEAGPSVTIPEGFQVRRTGHLLRYLEQHPHLVTLLRQARRVIGDVFGSVDVALDVVSDPEWSAPGELFASIRTSLTPAEAWRRLDRFDEAWVLPHIAEFRGLLNFDVEFRPDTTQLPMD